MILPHSKLVRKYVIINNNKAFQLWDSSQFKFTIQGGWLVSKMHMNVNVGQIRSHILGKL